MGIMWKSPPPFFFPLDLLSSIKSCLFKQPNESPLSYSYHQSHISHQCYVSELLSTKDLHESFCKTALILVILRVVLHIQFPHNNRKISSPRRERYVLSLIPIKNWIVIFLSIQKNHIAILDKDEKI